MTDWIARLTAAMDYIEAHLSDEIKWDEAARCAQCSTHLFVRSFALMTNVPLSEYVRRRRLTLAAQDLQQKGDKVIDVALRYGYASPTAFQRAFTLFHGITPREAKRPGKTMMSYPPMSFEMTIQGGVALQYRMEEKDAFRVVGVEEEVSMLGGENFARIPKMWDEFPPERYEALMQASEDGEMPGMLGVVDMGTKPESLSYMIGVISRKAELADWMVEREIPTARYAVFPTSLAELQEVTRRIFAQWLPNSGYEHGPSPEFEYYPPRQEPDAAKYMCEIWVPVVEK